jgi:hypothetical protein
MSEEERRTSSLEVENICNVNDADTAVIVAVGDHVQATNLRFNWIIIMELYNVRNMPGKALKRGTLVKKTVPRM